MTATATAWDALHQQARHRLEYPSEHVVRFLAGVELDPDDRRSATAVDIGCGSGRHANLLTQFGFAVSACDVSKAAVKTTRKMWDFAPRFVQQAPMTALPYEDETFDVAVAFGVFYYGTKDDHAQAVSEMHRVLRPGGRAFVCIRRHDDWRAQFVYSGVFHCVDQPEDGMPMHFLTQYEVQTMYAAFADRACTLETTTTSRLGRVDREWLLTLVKA